MITVYKEFPEEWLTNRHILYHGTSNFSESKIDSNGLLLPDVSVNKTIVERLRDICATDLHGFIGWSGLGGLGNLTYFESEFKDFTCRPLSFAHYPTRCIHFASEDNAGGEFIRTVIKSVSYLKDLCIKREAMSEWRNSVQIEWNDENSMLRREHSSMPTINVKQLEEKLKPLIPVYDDFVKIKESYEYGVIYAVDFSDIPVSCLAAETKGRGIYSTCSIPKENIVGKISKDKLESACHFSQKSETDAVRFWREKLRCASKNHKNY